MYKPDKATTERNAKILRELVKQPDNKLCADCKRNGAHTTTFFLLLFLTHGRTDPRGVYLCIRCSGIHRGMGTHISRVKSIDLDMWTPEQMESIQKWGNRRANLYWEAHLKAGHVPPDHKMESFIRSKYESRRWAMDGPLPSDPSVLEGPTHAARPTLAGLSAPRPASPSLRSPTTFRQNTAHSHSQSRQLLSAAVAGRVQVPSPPSRSQSQPPPPPPPQQQQQPKADDDLFSLDFHAPPTKPPSPPQPPAKDVKQDILSLFAAAPASAPAPPAQSVQPSNAFDQRQFASAQSWDPLGGVSLGQTQTQPISMMGTTGTGLWGVSSGWTGVPPTTTQPSANSIWGAPAAANAGAGTSTPNVALNTTDIWGGSNGLFAAQSTSAPASKKDDVFGDLWGDFK
ncbi:hypothetical protein HD554DRAFT_2152287 [Boletus coccyginus]|nr:hypothetical protein HD554DRAFT_2152287 [Boletus coccyginus]